MGVMRFMRFMRFTGVATSGSRNIRALPHSLATRGIHAIHRDGHEREWKHQCLAISFSHNLATQNGMCLSVLKRARVCWSGLEWARGWCGLEWAGVRWHGLEWAGMAGVSWHGLEWASQSGRRTRVGRQVPLLTAART